MKEAVELAGIVFRGTNLPKLKSNNFQIVITANAEFIVQAQGDNRFRELMNNNLTTLDGTIPYWLAKFFNRGHKLEKISGSDLIYHVAKWASEDDKRIFLLGGHPESNEGAIKKLKSLYPRLKIEGHTFPVSTYPFPDNIQRPILKQIEDFKPHYVFVAMGCKKQEFWIDDNKETLIKSGTELAIGCGGTFDFVSGRIMRAPRFIQKIGLESLWRLVMEPKLFRFKRLLVSFKIFYFVGKAKR